jgi:hypothetical protein
VPRSSAQWELRPPEEGEHSRQCNLPLRTGFRVDPEKLKMRGSSQGAIIGVPTGPELPTPADCLWLFGNMSAKSAAKVEIPTSITDFC